MKAGGVVEPVDMFQSFSLITEFGRSRSDSMGIRRDPEKFGERCPQPLGMGVDDLVIRSSPQVLTCQMWPF